MATAPMSRAETPGKVVSDDVGVWPPNAWLLPGLPLRLEQQREVLEFETQSNSLHLTVSLTHRLQGLLHHAEQHYNKGFIARTLVAGAGAER